LWIFFGFVGGGILHRWYKHEEKEEIYPIHPLLVLPDDSV